ncbi:hypothetical protein NQ318_022004 [Aromia moschata]|uniref:Uncharacterized protein n=1 Tax=Aromia moschata TaxID=1265417 RepID=A0AAV8Z7U8_9CUCU|nr:hypothetical protein NQ318_022004 [Aromia moschata]
MRQNVVAAVITSSPYKNNLIYKNKKKQEKENKLTRTKNKKKTGRKKNKTDRIWIASSEEEDAIQFDTDSEPDELMGQESPDC